ncbi:MAG: nitronate monooxygenase [Thalassospira sp.]|uniref:NAD(P)H-dependent flavin oxidoreductase n=1 Tax=Thalassospira sp. TaxID=1912094 RepID=UPI0032EE6072
MHMTSNVTGILGIDLPIIQGPFGGGISTPELVSAVSNRGGMGSFGAHIVAPDKMAELTNNLSNLTDGTFALNLWVSDHDPGGEVIGAEEFERVSEIFAPYYHELGVDLPTMPDRYHERFEDQVEALIEAKPPVFSFVFGVPSKAVIAKCKQQNIITIGTATNVAEGEALDAAGVDLIVATGFEAGGHRVSFLKRAEDSLIGTLALVPLIADRVSVPVIAAGGISDARGVMAALHLGAGAAQLGSAFLACSESGTNDQHRQLLLSGEIHDTVLTRTYTGRLARGVRNKLIDEMEARFAELPPFPVQAFFVSKIKAACIAQNRTEFTSIYAGQASANLKHGNVSSLMDALSSGLDARGFKSAA